MENTNGVIEVTNSFPVVESSADDGTSGGSEDRAFEDLVPAYQHFCKSVSLSRMAAAIGMSLIILALSQSGLDFNHVGYYVIAYLDNFYSKSFVDSIASRQAKNPHIVSVVLCPFFVAVLSFSTSIWACWMGSL